MLAWKNPLLDALLSTSWTSDARHLEAHPSASKKSERPSCKTHGQVVYISQAFAEVWYRVVRLPYNSFQVDVIKDTGRFERLAGLGVVMVVSGKHRVGIEKGIRFMMVDADGGMIVCCV